MPKLITDFVKIAQSGPCIDGRTIAPAWLTGMAETYDPATYTAYIWPDRIRWGNNYGTVVELQARDEDGVTSLYARLAPNAQYVWENQFDQLLHFSIEVTENFAGTGMAYLAGLGITDSPASLGTDALKFSLRGAGKGSQFFSNVPAVDLHPQDDEDTPSWFKKFMATFTPRTPNNSKDESMTPEQFDAFSKRLDGMDAALAEIKGNFASASAKADSPKAEAEPQSQLATEFSAAFAPILESFKSLSTQVSDMAKRFEATQPGTHTSASTGPAPDQGAPLL